MKTFLTIEEKCFGQLLRAIEGLDPDLKDCDVDDFAQNSPPEVTTKPAEWMDARLYTVLTLTTKDHPLQTVRNVADEEEVRGIAARHSWFGLTREKNANRCQQFAECVRDIKRVISCRHVFARMEKWDAAL